MSNLAETIKQPISTELISNEIKFLIVCCQMKVSENEIEFIRSFIQNPKFNIKNLLALANQHGIQPLVYKTLKNLQPVILGSHPKGISCSGIGDPQSQSDNSCASLLTTHYPLPTLINELKANYMGISQRNMLMSAELLKLIKLLQENDIESLAFKGPTLAQMAYRDITMRQFGDIDILIRKKDRYTMMDLLMKENFIPEIDLKKSTKETFFDSVNVIGFHNPSTGVYIEIHWELLSKNYAINWEEKVLWEKQETTLINQKEIPVLRLEQLLLYLCVHGAKHLFERLEWVCDIDRSIRANPHIDWSYLLDEAEKLGIKRMLLLGLALSQQLFKLELPQIVQKEIVQDKELPKIISRVIEINFSETSQEGRSYSSFGLLLNMRENLSDKLRFASHGLFAPKFDDFKFIQLPKYFAFLYPLIRPYRLITKYFKQ